VRLDRTAKELAGPDTTLFWLRRDLRLSDNAGLYHALREHANVLPVFIFDKIILDRLEDKADRRVAFIRETLSVLKAALEKLGSSLLVVHSDPVSFFKFVSPKAVYANGDYEPYAKTRDTAVTNLLQSRGIPFHLYKDQVIFEKEEITKNDGKPYTIFTPYSRKWKEKLKPRHYAPFSTLEHSKNLKQTAPLSLPSLTDISFEEIRSGAPTTTIRPGIIEHYHERRDFPAVGGTTRLSVHLRFGTVSIRKLVSLAHGKNETWLNELIWREFYHMILWHFPHVERAFKPAYDRIAWRNNPGEFQAWCSGNTGYPIVDAGMRELNETGFMHNRVRMVTASFLTKHLLIDWRWGEAYFAGKLLDFDLAANNGGWQWASGSGCDAAPYFRIFNPYTQTKRFDPDMKYIRKWVPEVASASYPKPIVDHAVARKRALDVYKEALQRNPL